MMTLCDQQGSLEGSGGKSGPQEKGPGPAGTERDGPGTERDGPGRRNQISPEAKDYLYDRSYD